MCVYMKEKNWKEEYNSDFLSIDSQNFASSTFQLFLRPF